MLIGHYLGVDHVGHTFDVHSQHMQDKLQQMDQHVAQVRFGNAHLFLLLALCISGQR